MKTPVSTHVKTPVSTHVKTPVLAHVKTIVSAHVKTIVSTHVKTPVLASAKKLFASLALAAVVVPVWAGTRTVTLSVPGMTCSACPITVKKAISKVEGVSKIDVAFEKREAVVTFDDARTSVQQLTTATANAGYPSNVKR